MSSYQQQQQQQQQQQPQQCQYWSPQQIGQQHPPGPQNVRPQSTPTAAAGPNYQNPQPHQNPQFTPVQPQKSSGLLTKLNFFSSKPSHAPSHAPSITPLVGPTSPAGYHPRSTFPPQSPGVPPSWQSPQKTTTSQSQPLSVPPPPPNTNQRPQSQPAQGGYPQPQKYQPSQLPLPHQRQSISQQQQTSVAPRPVSVQATGYQPQPQQQRVPVDRPVPFVQPQQIQNQQPPLNSRGPPPTQDQSNGVPSPYSPRPPPAQPQERPPQDQNPPSSRPQPSSMTHLRLEIPQTPISANAEARAHDSAEVFWDYVLDESRNPPEPKPIFKEFLRQLGQYIISTWEATQNSVISPDAMASYYSVLSERGSSRIDFFVYARTSPRPITALYDFIESQYLFIPRKPTVSSNSTTPKKKRPPLMPGLTLDGFERWIMVQMLLDPQREFNRLNKLLGKSDIVIPRRHPNAAPFPTHIPRGSFPLRADQGICEKYGRFFFPLNPENPELQHGDDDETEEYEKQIAEIRKRSDELVDEVWQKEQEIKALKLQISQMGDQLQQTVPHCHAAQQQPIPHYPAAGIPSSTISPEAKARALERAKRRSSIGMGPVPNNYRPVDPVSFPEPTIPEDPTTQPRIIHRQTYDGPGPLHMGPPARAQTSMANMNNTGRMPPPTRAQTTVGTMNPNSYYSYSSQPLTPVASPDSAQTGRRSSSYSLTSSTNPEGYGGLHGIHAPMSPVSEIGKTPEPMTRRMGMDTREIVAEEEEYGFGCHDIEEDDLEEDEFVEHRCYAAIGVGHRQLEGRAVSVGPQQMQTRSASGIFIRDDEFARVMGRTDV